MKLEDICNLILIENHRSPIEFYKPIRQNDRDIEKYILVEIKNINFYLTQYFQNLKQIFFYKHLVIHIIILESLSLVNCCLCLSQDYHMKKGSRAIALMYDHDHVKVK